ncbi:hypothetical protein NECID01_1347 [Nematocida sp. AWRm77]|nr:hypothetical protein NECID01_1347 [Nematocida sp. AWRm77]
MDILTRENTLLHVDVKKESAELLRDGIVYYEKNKKCTVLSTAEYLEVQTKEKTTRVHLFRPVERVHILEGLVYLVGDKWIECLEKGELKKEREFPERIVDTAVLDTFVLVLQQRTLTVLDMSLKRVERTKLQVKYPEQLCVHAGTRPVIGILSSTEKKAHFFSASGELVKTVALPAKPAHISLFEYKEKLYAAVAYKNALVLAEVFGEHSREVHTEHISSILFSQFSEADQVLYTFSKEGTVCTASIEEGNGEVVYVDPSGIQRAHVE